MSLISISQLPRISILGNLVENSRIPSLQNNFKLGVLLRPIRLPIQTPYRGGAGADEQVCKGGYLSQNIYFM